MLKEFAVDPDGLGRLGPLWVLMEQFGIDKGRVIARFPKSWTRMVYDAMVEADCPDVEKKKLVERLKRLKTSLGQLSGSRKFAKESWIESAKLSNLMKPFHAVISDEPCEDLNNAIQTFDATDDNPLWRISEPPIPRTAEEIACCAGPLGKISRELLFVDPHLGPDWKRLNVVREVLKACGATKREFRRIELHVSQKAGDLDQLARTISKQVLTDLSRHTEVRIFQWEKKSTGDVMHARYFLTERGGIRFDYGLAVGNLGETTDVQLLDQATYEIRWKNYQKKTAAFDLIGDIVCRPIR